MQLCTKQIASNCVHSTIAKGCRLESNAFKATQELADWGEHLSAALAIHDLSCTHVKPACHSDEALAQVSSCTLHRPSLIGCKLAPWAYVDPHPVCSWHASAYSSHSILQLGCFLAQKAAICCQSLPNSGQTALGNITALCCGDPLFLDAADSCIH